MTPCRTPTAAPPTSARRSSAAPRPILAKWPTCGVLGSCCTPCWWAATPSTTRTPPCCFPKSAEASAVFQKACRPRPSVCSKTCWGKTPQRDSPPPSCRLTRGSTCSPQTCRWGNTKRARQNKLCRLSMQKRMTVCFAEEPDWGSDWRTKTKLALKDLVVFVHWHFLETFLVDCCVCTYILMLSKKKKNDCTVFCGCKHVTWALLTMISHCVFFKKKKWC